MTKKKVLRIAAVVAAILVAIYAFSVLTDSTRGYSDVDTSVAVKQLDDKNVEEVQINDREQQLQITLKDKISVDGDDDVEKIITKYPARAADTIFEKVQASDAGKYQTKVSEDSFLGSLLVMLLPILIIGGLLLFFLTRMQGGAGGAFGIGKSKAKELNVDNPDTTFDDVAGADEAVEELDEIRDFLQDPARYEELGAKVPRGVLLYGPPGTGKTLLARAVAGEAGVPFYTISGSDFVEMFVGVGASRVRDLFKTAKENSPCIIFVDEIDAVGRQRGAGMGGGHDEREQTLNQLLVEMDGFDDREGVILMAATNRPDILDPALLRPGRFDRQIPVGNPDLAGREQILRVHAKNKPLAPDVDLKSLAKRTVGMSGADLANVLNEAALLTARVDGNVITGDALEEATDRVIGGPRRTSKIISEHEKKVTAYHEGGHTLAAWGIKDIERVYKVTILARGKTGGHAMAVPEDDKGMYTRSELFARLVFAMGGRSAEELVFGAPTTGASADIEQATKIARGMVTEYGMSPQLGAVKYGEEQGDPFAGRPGQGTLDYSPAVAATIDDQVRMLIEKAHVVAYRILRENRDYLDTLATKLLEKETLRRPDLEAIFGEMPLVEVNDIFDGQDVEFPRDFREPVKTPNELAKERGEEPPVRPDFYSEARKARMERRKAAQEAKRAEQLEQDQQRQQGQQGQQGQNQVPPKLPGFPPQQHGQQGQQPGQPRRDHLWGGQDRANPPGDPLNNPYGQAAPRHPGEQNYGPGPDRGSGQGPSQGPSQGPAQGEIRGFRLPDNEQPDHPWVTDDAPTGRHHRVDPEKTTDDTTEEDR
ncbi:ATP-dependent zinc metalloprotease FtsH [Corynebacterium variabile]|uniref:ATP-dependent zinc metalloprotease FtsH n=1 Tax=Corynebacterium variabile TaxID=1727 RepID=UPI003F9DE9D3